MPTTDYEESARDYALRAEAAASAASTSKQNAQTAATTAATQASIATNAATNAATLAAVQLQQAVDASKSAAQSAASASANSASASAASATEASSYVGSAENAASAAVSAKNDAVSAKNDAVSAKGDAVSAAGTASQAKDDAVSAKVDAVSAKNDAVSAKNDAVQAKNDAVLSAGTASTASTNAQIAAEGTDEQAASIGLFRSCKGWHDVIAASYRAIRLGPCTAMGMVRGSTSVQLMWTDPEDVMLNGAPLAEWWKTELWMLQSGTDWPEFPGQTGCTLVAKTESGTEMSKDAYSTTALVVDNLTENLPYAFALFSFTKDGAVTILNANRYPITTTWNWQFISQFSQAGTLPNYVSEGQLLNVRHTVYGDTIPVRLMDFDGVAPWDPTVHRHATVFESVDCILSEAFDSAEQQYALTADTTAVSGKTYYTVSGSTYTALTEGTDWDAGDPVPAFSWYEKNPDPNYGNGNNTYRISDVDSFLDCDRELVGNDPKNLWETTNAYGNMAGFIYGLKDGLKDLLIPCRRTIALATAYGGGYYEIKRRVFLPTRYEVMGTKNNNVAEGVRRWHWYADHSTNANRIKCVNSVPSSWWEASPNVSNGNYVYYLSTSGAEGNGYSSYKCGVPFAFAL